MTKKPCGGCKDPVSGPRTGGLYLFVGGPKDGQRMNVPNTPATYIETLRTGEGVYEQHAYFRRSRYYLHEGFVPCLK